MSMHRYKKFGRLVQVNRWLCDVAPLEIDRALAENADILAAKVAHWERRASQVVWNNVYETGTSRQMRGWALTVNLHFPTRKVYALRRVVVGSVAQLTQREED